MSELAERLIAYEQSYAQLSEVLQADPTNTEILKLLQDVQEAITLTRELLGVTDSNQDNSPPGEATTNSQSPVISVNVDDGSSGEKSPQDETYESFRVSEGISSSEGRNSSGGESSEPPLPGGIPKSFKVGTLVEAKWTDGAWYEARIESIDKSNSKIRIVFSNYNHSEELSVEEIRTIKSTKKRSLSELTLSEDGQLKIPKSLQIHPNDSEEAKSWKKKRLKYLKSQLRLQNKEEERNTRKTAWKDFSSKSNKPKTGFMTGRKKESIFKSPDTVDGKVGVVGSGKGMTKFSDTRTKYFELKKG